MAAKKPFIFTAVSYIVQKTGDGSVRCRQETVFEQMPSPKGTIAFRPIKQTVFMPEPERAEYDRKMMANAGKAVSDYLSGHTEGGVMCDNPCP